MALLTTANWLTNVLTTSAIDYETLEIELRLGFCTIVVSHCLCVLFKSIVIDNLSFQ
jgi:hypothetical protein